MLSLFRNNSFLGLVFLLIYTFLLRLPALLGLVSMPEPMESQIGILGFGVVWEYFQDHPTLSILAAGFLAFSQGLLINHLDTRHRLADDRTWLPAAFYVLLTALFPSTLFLNPVLLAATFIPLALDSIFRCYKSVQPAGLIFNIGFWLALSGLFFPAAALFIVVAFLSVYYVKSFSVRENMIFLSGSLVPLFLVWTGYFMYDATDSFMDKQFDVFFRLPQFDLWSNHNFWLQFLSMFLLFIFVLFNIGSVFSKKLIQVQKFISILYWFSIIALVIFLFSGANDFRYWQLILPMLALLIALSFTNKKTAVKSEIFHLILVLTTVFFQLGLVKALTL